MTLSPRHRRDYTLVKSLCGTALKSLFWALPVHQDLSTSHDWPVKCHFQFVDQDERKFETHFRELES